MLSGVAQTPPSQPLLGPGGKTYDHKGVRITEHSGDSTTSFLIVEPVQPQPDSAEVIFLFNGSHNEERTDGELRLYVEHIARNGYIVIWPKLDRLDEMVNMDLTLENQKALMRDAMKVIKRREGRVRPLYWDDGKIKWAFVCIHEGSVYGFDLSARHRQLGLPEVDAIVAITPEPAHEYEGISPNTRIVIISAEDDDVNGPDAEANRHRQVWDDLKEHPCINKAYFTLRSDDYGTPALEADHHLFMSSASPDGGVSPDALDYYGTWKWTIATMNCAFRNKDCQYAFGFDNSSIFMGKWTDGHVVRPALKARDCGESEEEHGEFVNSDIHLYPNPAKGVFTVQGINDNIKVRVYDPTGTQIRFMRNDNVFHLVTRQTGEFVVILEDTTGKGYLHKVMVW